MREDRDYIVLELRSQVVKIEKLETEINCMMILSFTVTEKHQALPQVSCDVQTNISMLLGDRVLIRQSEEQLTLLHPPGYSYYEVCRSKLQWGGRIEPQQDDE